MTTDPDARAVARILRGLKERVSDLEQKRRRGGDLTKIRNVSDEGLAADSVTVTENTSPTMTWDGTASTDEWEIGEWS